jgi:hypothetical protein
MQCVHSILKQSIYSQTVWSDRCFGTHSSAFPDKSLEKLKGKERNPQETHSTGVAKTEHVVRAISVCL